MVINRIAGAVRVLGAAMLLVGVILSLMAAVRCFDSWSFLSQSERVWGAVVDMETKLENGVAQYALVIEYHDAGNGTHRLRGVWSTMVTESAVGRPIEVAYRRDQPDDARIASYSQLWGTASVLGGFGVPMTLIGLALTFWAPGWIVRFWGAPPLPPPQEL